MAIIDIQFRTPFWMSQTIPIVVVERVIRSSMGMSGVDDRE
jgi:hypothetical protein